MSTTVDERVVEMRFDNKQFESNVKTSMSTLEKLKQSLKFKGETKGFDNISSSVKKVDMNSLGKSVEVVRNKFSALEVMTINNLSLMLKQACQL